MAQESNDDPFQAIGYGDFGTYIKNKKAKLQLQFDETYGLKCSQLNKKAARKAKATDTTDTCEQPFTL